MTNNSERLGNPYISTERLNREHPLKFGLRKKSYNTHLSSQMEARSPKFDGIAGSESGAAEGPTNLILSGHEHESA